MPAPSPAALREIFGIERHVAINKAVCLAEEAYRLEMSAIKPLVYGPVKGVKHMEKSRFEVYLHSVLTEAQIGLLKESLLAGRRIYFYGEEGTGKSMLCSILSHNGFGGVFEPGSVMAGGSDDPIGPFTLPKNPRGVVLLELYGLKKHLDLTEVLGFTRSDIVAWLTA